MSKRALGWALAQKLKGAPANILIHLSDISDPAGLVSFTVHDLSRKSCVHRQTIYRALGILRNERLISAMTAEEFYAIVGVNGTSKMLHSHDHHYKLNINKIASEIFETGVAKCDKSLLLNEPVDNFCDTQPIDSKANAKTDNLPVAKCDKKLTTTPLYNNYNNNYNYLSLERKHIKKQQTRVEKQLAFEKMKDEYDWWKETINNRNDFIETVDNNPQITDNLHNSTMFLMAFHNKMCRQYSPNPHGGRGGLDYTEKNYKAIQELIVAVPYSLLEIRQVFAMVARERRKGGPLWMQAQDRLKKGDRSWDPSKYRGVNYVGMKEGRFEKLYEKYSENNVRDEYYFSVPEGTRVQTIETICPDCGDEFDNRSPYCRCGYKLPDNAPKPFAACPAVDEDTGELCDKELNVTFGYCDDHHVLINQPDSITAQIIQKSRQKTLSGRVSDDPMLPKPKKGPTLPVNQKNPKKES